RTKSRTTLVRQFMTSIARHAGSQRPGRILFTKFSDCRRVQLVLSNLNPGMQAFRSIVSQDRHLALAHDLPMIDFFVDKMYRAARYSFAGCQRLLPSFESRKFWQQCRMDVDDAPRKCVEHRCMQYAHETGEHDKINTGLSQHFDQRFFYFG